MPPWLMTGRRVRRPAQIATRDLAEVLRGDDLWLDADACLQVLRTVCRSRRAASLPVDLEQARRDETRSHPRQSEPNELDVCELDRHGWCRVCPGGAE